MAEEEAEITSLSEERNRETSEEKKQRAHSAIRITDDSARANLTFMGAKQRFVGANAKNMGANVAIVTFAPTIPCFAQRNLLYSTSVINNAMNYGINNEESP